MLTDLLTNCYVPAGAIGGPNRTWIERVKEIETGIVRDREIILGTSIWWRKLKRYISLS